MSKNANKIKKQQNKEFKEYKKSIDSMVFGDGYSIMREDEFGNLVEIDFDEMLKHFNSYDELVEAFIERSLR